VPAYYSIKEAIALGLVWSFCLFLHSWELQLYVKNSEAKCTLLVVQHFRSCCCFVH